MLVYFCVTGVEGYRSMLTWVSISSCERSTTSLPHPLEALVTGPLLLLAMSGILPTVRGEVSVQKGLLEPHK